MSAEITFAKNVIALAKKFQFEPCIYFSSYEVFVAVEGLGELNDEITKAICGAPFNLQPAGKLHLGHRFPRFQFRVKGDFTIGYAALEKAFPNARKHCSGGIYII